MEKWAHHHGFGDALAATEQQLRAFSKQYGGSAPGLYLWEDSEHHIYVGISERHVATRLRSHIRDFRSVSNIQAFRYRKDTRGSRELRNLERELVHSAVEDRSNFVVMNREHAAVIFGDSEFDVVLAPAEQFAWLEDPIAEWDVFDGSRSSQQSEAAKKAWLKFAGRDDSGAIIDAVALYARLCIPHAAATEYEWWVVTCPGWKKGVYERVCTLSISFLEVLWFTEDLESGRVSVRVGTDFQFLPTLWSTAKLRMESLGKVHPSAGPFEEVISFDSVQDFVNALHKSAALRRGAARFALDRMRTGRVGRYKESHSPQLATAALRSANDLEVSPVECKSIKTVLSGGVARLKRRN
ncbi:hypothetical protein ASG12_07720 [Williamsia sp. Leaf354]|uniref:GIY-YIG nuclease family protein n=1 Tax=Williamsia sp. Leaf354 TaxID=1736349 RepID=UPI00070222A6|nr:GIY-YIG nuclease family protein [Williamsia sp. Leaf354]KQS00739.1 hypothetical protein ASG12_07720 [Williamsia sp. Leaf354]